MFPFGGLLDSELDDAAHIYVGGISGSTSVASLGASAGNLVVIYSGAFASAPTSSGGGTWNLNMLSSPLCQNTYWKVLNSADAAGSITASGAIIIYRGPASAQAVVNDQGGGGTIFSTTAAGFTRSPNHAGLVGFVCIKDYGSGTIATPATWNYVGAANIGAVGGFTYSGFILDRLAPPTTPYANGASFTYGAFAGGSNPNYRHYLLILELLR